MLDHGYDAMLDMELLPASCTIKTTGDIYEASKLAEKFPPIMAMAVTDGWMRDEVSVATGQINEYHAPEQSLSGHALTWAKTYSKDSGQYMMFNNSGWYNWGYRKAGYGMMTVGYLDRSLLDDFVWVDIPDSAWDHIRESFKATMTQDWGTDERLI